MKINRFFTDTLGVKLRNPRWSWGATDDLSDRIFLRIWEDQMRQSQTGQQVQIYWKHPRNKSNGYAERLEQVELLRAGTKGFGILTIAVDPNAQGPRQIKSFREDILFQLGALSEDDDGIYAQLGRSVPTNQILATRSISPKSIPTSKELSAYEKAVRDGAVGKLTRGVRIRCQKLRARARQYYRGADGKLRCGVCDWHKTNDKISGDIVEIHHIRPLADLPPEGVQQLLEEAIKSLMPLCPCCHRIAHSRHGNIRRPFTVDELMLMVPKYPFSLSSASQI